MEQSQTDSTTLQRVTAEKNSKRVAAGRKGAEARKKLRELKDLAKDSTPLTEHAVAVETLAATPEKTTLDTDIWANPKVLLALGVGGMAVVAYFLYSKRKPATPVVPVSRSHQTPNLEVLLNTSNDNDIFTL